MSAQDHNKDHNLVLDGHKLLFHLDRVRDWLAGKRIAPITVDMALTRSCNYRCVYCYGMLQENERYPLDHQHLMRFIDDAAEVGIKAISLVSDGESILSPHMYDYVSYGRKRGIDMALGTNGSVLKLDKLPQLLADLTYLRFNISAGESHRYAEIHGVPESFFERVCGIVRECVRIKRERELPVTLGLQMVLLPHFGDQVLPLAKLGRELGVDYLVIKHCSDDEEGSLGVDYAAYAGLKDLLHEAESYSTDTYLVKAKWSKIMSGGKRRYSRCYGAPFIIQFSGSGLMAPCGPLFGEKYKRFHIGNLAKQSFKELWGSDRYWEVMDYIASDKFNAHTECGTLCLQHKVNEFLWDLKEGNIDVNSLKVPDVKPLHVNFI